MNTKKPSSTDHLEAPWSIEEVARQPMPGAAFPSHLTFSPDDQRIAYLFSSEGSLINQLFSFDPETGEHDLVVAPPDGGTTEETVSLEEALRRERQRQRALGITQYAWSKSGNRILVPLRGNLYVQEGIDGSLVKILDSGGVPALDPQFSPDGRWVAYVQDAELFVIPVEGGEPVQLTHGARGTGRTHGLAEYIAQEEMGRRHGFWWSPDSQWIAFTRVDETHIPVYRIVHQAKDVMGEGSYEDHRYPFAGEPNATVQLGVIPLEGGEPVWMDLGEAEFYLARVNWLPDGGLSAQLENREQTELEWVRLDPKTGQRSVLVKERNDIWINLHTMFRPLKKVRKDGGKFIWASERTGFFHLYLYDENGELIRPLTAGEWLVDAVAAVDEVGEKVFFMATRDGPTERHLYVVSLSGGEPRRITQEPGMHDVVIDHSCRRFVDTHQTLDTPPKVRLCSLEDGAVLQTLYDTPDPRVAELALRPPELVSFKNRDGVTLYGMIYHPPDSFGSGPFPTIVSVYGGPGAQRVANSWLATADMRAQYLSNLGFLVFRLDNRGSRRRGLDFEGAIKHHMGHIEVADQVEGVRWLVERGLADPDRVGIYGWSYGGYMAVMCLAQAPDTFRVAVAGASVVHWDGYDTHYTERYMGTPQTNPEGYAQSSVAGYVDQIEGNLLLVHGLLDENVHFRHTARLVQALTRAGKLYDLIFFPNGRHSLRQLDDRIYLETRIRNYFVEHL